MLSSSIHGRRALSALVVWAVAVVFLSGCAPIPTVIGPPEVPEEISGVKVHASPADIALGRADLPAGFQLAAEKAQGVEYVALYLRPSALDVEASGGNTLLSVMTSVGVYTTTVDAEQVYLKANADLDEQGVEDAALVSSAATNVVTEPFTGAARGADASEAFRVTYQLKGQNVYEYGHRFRIGNVLAYVVVTSLGNPDEPESLLKSARDLVQRQIERIVRASDKSTTE